MSPITHFFMGWAVANSAPSLSKRERAFVTWASVAPDVDGLGILADWATRGSTHPLNWWEYHHQIGHNIGFAALLVLLTVLFAQQKIKTSLLVLISFHLHILGDLAGAGGPDGDQWPIPYLLPFSNGLQLRWSGQWALNAWPNMVISAVLIAIALMLARRRGFSPLEMFSSKADAAFVHVLRSRFPMDSLAGPAIG